MSDGAGQSPPTSGSAAHRWRWAPLAVIGALVIALALVAAAYISADKAEPIERGLTDDSVLGWPSIRPTSTSAPTPAPTATDCPGETIPNAPEEAARDLYLAWIGQLRPARACAARVATPSVVNYITATGITPDPTWPAAPSACYQHSTIAGVFHCQWQQVGTTRVILQMRVEAVAGGYVVTAVRIPGTPPIGSATSSPSGLTSPSQSPGSNPSPTESMGPT